MARLLDRSLSTLRRRILLAAWAGTFLRHLLIGLFVAGTAALLARIVFDMERIDAVFAFGLLILAPLSAWLVVRGRGLSLAGAAAWLDVHGGSTGAVVTGLEVDDPRWQDRCEAALVRAGGPPGIRIGRPLVSTLPGIAFAALALWVEVPETVTPVPTGLADAAVERLKEKLETLEEVVEFEPETAAELESRLDRLEEEDTRQHPESTFEAIDRMEERLEQEALELAEVGQEVQDSLERAQRDASQDAGSAQDELERAMSELMEAGLAKNMPETLEALLEGMNAEGLELPAGTELDAESLRNLSEELAELMKGKIGKLGKVGLLDADALKKAGKLGNLDEFKFADHECDEDCKKPGGT